MGGNCVLVKGFEKGYYLEFIVIEVFDVNCCVNQEEIFGLVVIFMFFEIEEEVLDYVNGVKYGFFVIFWISDFN